MKRSGPHFSPKLWKNLMLLGQKQGPMKVKDLGHEMGLSEVETLDLLKEFFPTGAGAEVSYKDDECWVDIEPSAIQYMLPLTPTEWLQLHELLSSQAASSLKKKVQEYGPAKMILEVLGHLEHFDNQTNEFQQDTIRELDMAANEKRGIKIITKEDKTLYVMPCKILHLEGELSLIAEDINDHCLTVISLKDLGRIEALPLGNTQRVSGFEVEEFITAIRAMNEKEARLILKIHDPQSVNLFPDYHFLGKPCMVTNPNGDLIWAAYVEPCPPLYEWLLTLGSHVEILDPMKFKQEYLSYCEEKIRKIA